jgi:hypothetical protein
VCGKSIGLEMRQLFPKLGIVSRKLISMKEDKPFSKVNIVWRKSVAKTKTTSVSRECMQ